MPISGGGDGTSSSVGGSEDVDDLRGCGVGVDERGWRDSRWDDAAGWQPLFGQHADGFADGALDLGGGLFGHSDGTCGAVDQAPDPAWALQASAQVQREQLAELADGPAGPDTAQVLARFDPDGPDRDALDGAALIQAIKAAQRVINWSQALQQRFIAALARPGVAVLLPELVDTCRHPGSCGGGSFRPPDDLPDLPADPDGGPDYRPLLHDPRWADALADTAARLASVEVGCALHLSPVTARIRTERAVSMVDTLPATIAAQQNGDVDGYRAAVIADRTQVLAPEERRAVERLVLPRAVARTGAGLRDLVDREVIAVDPRAAERRVAAARRARSVWVDKAQDDMACFRAMLYATDAQLAYGVLDHIAVGLTAAGLAGKRGVGQLRADAFADLFHTLATTGHATITTDGGDDDTCASESADRNGPGRNGSGRGGRKGTEITRRHSNPVCLNVYLHASTLAGDDDLPGELAGHGSITADTARAIAASANTLRVLAYQSTIDTGGFGAVDTGDARAGGRYGHSANAARARACGSILDAGRAVYRPPVRTAEHVTARDRRCQFPGCRAPAARCDIDHREPFQNGGVTCPCNLDLLCRFHHRVKTFTGWCAIPGADGRLIWTSPTGSTYSKEPTHTLLDTPADTSTSYVATIGVGVKPPVVTARAPADDPPPF